MIKVKKGQALILILLVMAISLTLGVSVASRSITTLKQVSFSAQSAQALAFAEGGIEEALKCLDDGSCAVPSDPAAVDLTGDGTNDFDYRITALGGAVLDSFPPLSRDEAIELSLSGYPSSTPMYISWVNTAKPSEVADPAAVEFAAIYQEAGVYKVLRYAYDPDASRASENGFFTPFTGGFSVNGVTYAYRVSISVPFTPIALRIRPLYSTTASSFVFSAETGRTLPTTGSRIESTGTSGSVQRKIEVLRTNSSLSELFDFALFSGSETSPLSK
ncbi:MAG: protein of unknown function with transmembrane region [candidate division WWE3 bacterium CSP1-7]|uniref:Type 4 fimbrial biogenesis protein PilX N-terminal domain-containing protein n=1 Tax=candidate division WWE3 bacterium CSP1-7 TaxID=1576480 RepID=A0A0T5ZXE5_UNCKA|nr:MAG: protein of unknown function with transmembrane region [candidate division WWE3 bacterium CSP1-7]